MRNVIDNGHIRLYMLRVGRFYQFSCFIAPFSMLYQKLVFKECVCNE